MKPFSFFAKLFKKKTLDIIVETTHPMAILPTYGTTKAADCDFYSPSNVTIQPKSKVMVDLGVKMHLPSGYRMKLESRSGLSAKFSVEVGAGVIDEDYREPIKVILYNHGDGPVVVCEGDRICQGSIEKYEQFNFMFGLVSKDTSSTRTGGIGSTGR